MSFHFSFRFYYFKNDFIDDYILNVAILSFVPYMNLPIAITNLHMNRFFGKAHFIMSNWIDYHFTLRNSLV